MEVIKNGACPIQAPVLPIIGNDRFQRDIHVEHYPDDLWSLTRAFRQHAGSELKTREFQPSPSNVPRINRIMFPTPDGYVTARDRCYQDFIISVYNELQKIGEQDTRLLINPAFTYPYLPQMYPSNEYRVAQSVMGYIPKSEKLVRGMMTYSLRNCHYDDVNIRMKKHTSPGYPFTFSDRKTQWSATLNEVGFRGNYNDPIRRFAVNYKSVKESWLPKLVNIQNDILGEVGKPYDPQNIYRRVKNFSCSVYREGGRVNSIDKIISIGDDKIDINHVPLLYGKDRPFAYVSSDGMITTGKNDVRSYAQYCRDFSRGSVRFEISPEVMAYNRSYGECVLAPHRHRTICSHSFVSTSIYQALYQPLLKGLEESKYGFLGDTDAIKQRVKRFMDNTKGELYYVTGDRMNAEAFFSTNFNIIKPMFPNEIIDLIEISSMSLKLDKNGPILTSGLISGAANTTCFNVWLGTGEAFNAISYITRASYEDCVDAYLTMLGKDEDYFSVNGIDVLLFLCTDDVCFITRSSGNFRRLPKDFGGERLMTYETSMKCMQGSFGVYIDQSGLRPDPHSQISKIMFIERPGYVSHDAWSITSRLNLVNQDIVDIINFNLRKYMNFDVSWFYNTSNQFLADLKALGLSFTDVLNEYSPKDRIVLGQFVDLEDMTSVDRFPDDITHSLVDGFLSSSRWMKENFNKEGL